MFKKIVKKSNIHFKNLLEEGGDNEEHDRVEGKEEAKQRNEENKKLKSKGLQYNHTQFDFQMNTKKSAPPKEVLSEFEKEWAMHNQLMEPNEGKIDNFLEEKLREFHQKVNSVASSEGVWTNNNKEQATKDVLHEEKEKQDKIDKFSELNKLKELHKEYHETAKEQSVWITGLREINVPLEEKVRIIEEMEKMKKNRFLNHTITDLKNNDTLEKQKQMKEKVRKRKEFKSLQKNFRKEGRIFKTNQLKKRMFWIEDAHVEKKDSGQNNE